MDNSPYTFKHMYFEDRHQAGQELAEKLFHAYSRTEVVILALSPGSVAVAEPIAQLLRAPIILLQMRDVSIPGASNAPRVGTIDQAGGFTDNAQFSKGEIDEFVSEFHNHIESQKMSMMHEMNRMTSSQEHLKSSYLNDKNIILVSDGLDTSSYVDSAVAFLKPIRTARVVAATPVASVPAVDKLHLSTDEIHILSVKENYVSTDHYYDHNDIPDEDEIKQRLKLFDKFL